MTDVHFEVAGTGPRVLLVQGTGVAGCGWSPQVEGLRRDFELAWFDNRGVGQTPGAPGDLSDMAGCALEVLDALRWDRAHVVGHSLGGVIAQRLALDHPERVASLALLCTFAQGRASLDFGPSALWRQLRMMLGSRAAKRRAFFELVSPRDRWGSEEGMAELERVFGRGLDALPPAAMAQVRVLVGADLRAELPALRGVRSLVVSATEDRVAPVAQGPVLASCLGGQFVEVPGGHAVTVQDAARVNALLRDHLLACATLSATPEC